MSIDVRAAIAAEVRAELARQSKTQRDVAAALGMEQAGVSLRCRGVRPFRAEELVALAEWLGVPVTQFTSAPERVA